MSSHDVVIRIDRKVAVLLAALIIVGAFSRRLWSESLTLRASYPALSGIYNQIVTTGNLGKANTILNRDAGNTILVPPTNNGGMVGIGTENPKSKLDVNGMAHMTNLHVHNTADVKNLIVNGPATEGTECNHIGLVTSDSNGLLLSCQNIAGPRIGPELMLKKSEYYVWKPAMGSANVGGYLFRLNNDSSRMYYGIGKYEGGKFSGTVICTPKENCGSDGYEWCGSDPQCVKAKTIHPAGWKIDLFGKSIQNIQYFRAGVADLAISDVTLRWPK